MTLALSPTVKRICLQLAVARNQQKRPQADAAKVAGLSIKGLTALYAGRGCPSLQSLDALARWHGLGHITVIARPAVLDDKMLNCENPLPMLNMLNMEQTFRRVKQQTLRAESRFIYLQLGLGHRTLSSVSVADMQYNIGCSASDVDIKARILGQGGLCLRSRFLGYGHNMEETLDLDGAVPMPSAPSNTENFRLSQGRARTAEMDELDAMLAEGQTNATANVVPAPELYDGDDQQELTPELEAQLFGNLTPPTN